MPDPTEAESWDLRHLPLESSTRPYMAGHLHPGYRLSRTGRDTLRSPCWVLEKSDSFYLPLVDLPD